MCLIFERADAGRLGVAHLQRGDDAARFVAQRAHLVERRVVAGARRSRRRGGYAGSSSASALPQFVGERGIGLAQRLRSRIGDVARHRRRKADSRVGEFRRGDDAVAHGGEIARSAAADDDARQRAREIGRRA